MLQVWKVSLSSPRQFAKYSQPDHNSLQYWPDIWTPRYLRTNYTATQKTENQMAWAKILLIIFIRKNLQINWLPQITTSLCWKLFICGLCTILSLLSIWSINYRPPCILSNSMTTLYQKTANISACVFYEYQGSRQFCDISANWATLTGATAVARNVLECAAKCQILDQDTDSSCNAFKYYNETLSCEMAQVDTAGVL